LGGIKQLANQTLWFGLSNILGRFISYLLTPILLYSYHAGEFGDISILFASAAFLNIIFTYGMETSYFRFNQVEDEKKVFNTAFSSLIITTLLFSFLLIPQSQQLANMMQQSEHPDFVVWVIAIVALDTLSVLPFSKLRHAGRPRKFALIKLANILINVGLAAFFLLVCKPAQEAGTGSFLGGLYDPVIGIGYVFISQLLASIITLALLFREWKDFRLTFDKKLLTELLIYSLPLVVVGFGGMINETIDRFMVLMRFSGTVLEAKAANGIYSANYKLAILIVIFIQTFRMGAEPFFFKNASSENAKNTYARIMNLFVIACCICYLGVVLYLDIWKHFMSVKKHPEYMQGLVVVPILMLSKIFLGIYYNLSIWYKLTNKNSTGAVITIVGALITLLVNYLFIPSLGYLACAWATVACYGTMMLMSYFLGQKHYPIPYEWKKVLGYIGLSVLLYLVHALIRANTGKIWLLHGSATLLMLIFIVIVVVREKAELIKIPLIKKLYR
jgi:O-antigen/teichoic acid export membrane protein